MADAAQPQPMLSAIAGRVWWMLFLRGMLAVLFGLAALFWPGKTLFVLILLFGAYTLVDGVFAIVGGIMDSSRRWLLLIEGALGMVAGLILLVNPGLGVADDLRWRTLGALRLPGVSRRALSLPLGASPFSGPFFSFRSGACLRRSITSLPSVQVFAPA